MSEASRPLRSPLHEAHLAAGGKLVEFAGWELPVHYGGVIEEHHAVRSAAGLFDVTHMGELKVSGEGAVDFVQKMTPNNVRRLKPGACHYSGLLTEEGTYVDDLLVYRLGESELLLVVNAANREKDFAWLRSRADDTVTVEDASADYALLALQGPRAAEILAGLTGDPVAELGYYKFLEGAVAGAAALVSRTGYTGEDGFEIYVAPRHAVAVWEALFAAGAAAGLRPAGLGARDTLRLEAGMALYGHEIDETTTPFEAGLDWVVKMKKGDFVGREALAAQRQRGLERKLVGFELRERGIPRQGHEVVAGDRVVGRVTSGTFSPTLERSLGMAYVPLELATPGSALEIQVRKRRLAAEVVSLPFYKRAGAAGDQD